MPETLPLSTLNKAARLAYLYGVAETRFEVIQTFEGALHLVQTWKNLDEFQKKLEFCFYGKGPTPPEAVQIAERFIARRTNRG